MVPVRHLTIGACLAVILLWPFSARAEEDRLGEARTLSEQGISLYQEGRLAEAERPFQRALAIREEVLGPEHTDVGVSLISLARLYRAQGRYGDAEPLGKRALVIFEKSLGPEHSAVVVTLDYLGGLYREQGRYTEAEPLYQRVLATREKLSGPE